jgi:hypothetical protein
MAEVEEYRRRDYDPDGPVVYRSADNSASYAGAIILFVLLLFLFGLLFYMNQDRFYNWNRQTFDYPVVPAPTSPQTEIVPVPIPVPTSTPAPSAPSAPPTIINVPPPSNNTTTVTPPPSSSIPAPSNAGSSPGTTNEMDTTEPVQ